MVKLKLFSLSNDKRHFLYLYHPKDDSTEEAKVAKYCTKLVVSNYINARNEIKDDLSGSKSKIQFSKLEDSLNLINSIVGKFDTVKLVKLIKLFRPCSEDHIFKGLPIEVADSEERRLISGNFLSTPNLKPPCSLCAVVLSKK